MKDKIELYFPPVEQFEHLIINQPIIKNYPFCIDIIDTRSKVYDEYYDMMVQRMARYPNLQYFFLTSSPKYECFHIFSRYPLFMKQVNFVVFTQEIQNIIKAFQIPFCCLINEKQQIVYKGPTATQNYALIISRLNEIKKPKQLQEVVKIIQEPELKNNDLSLLLAGLSARHREVFFVTQKLLSRESSSRHNTNALLQSLMNQEVKVDNPL
ncbi:Conserved_hypothetical protein [Hexamita inflata]|uniref:Uncharacterized protein n=1 Tax=Hexamita inflata TaxID=28002 RepID=A0ABP1HYF8_9EUKA